MCADVTPSDRQCGPPELLATLPPIEQLCWLLGSGAKCRPCARHGAAEVEVEHARLDPRQPVDRSTERIRFILVSDDHDRVVERCRAAGQAGARTAGDERRVVARPRCRTHRLHLVGRRREADHRRRALDVRRVAPVQRELGRADAHPVGAERGARGRRAARVLTDRLGSGPTASMRRLGRRAPARSTITCPARPAGRRRDNSIVIVVELVGERSSTRPSRRARSSSSLARIACAALARPRRPCAAPLRAAAGDALGASASASARRSPLRPCASRAGTDGAGRDATDEPRHSLHHADLLLPVDLPRAARRTAHATCRSRRLRS